MYGISPETMHNSNYIGLNTNSIISHFKHTLCNSPPPLAASTPSLLQTCPHAFQLLPELKPFSPCDPIWSQFNLRNLFYLYSFLFKLKYFSHKNVEVIVIPPRLNENWLKTTPRAIPCVLYKNVTKSKIPWKVLKINQPIFF